MLFRLEDVYKSYGAHEVLRGATLQVNPGERIGLVGRNGAGKTTIFRLIARREEPDRGEVIQLRGLRTGVLDQQPIFDGSNSVRDEALSVFQELRSIETELSRLEHRMGETTGETLDQVMHDYSDLRHRYEMEGGFTYQSRAEAVLAGLGFSRDDFSRPSDQLSGGEKARLALTKLLLTEPDVLLLDEPTNHLDVGAVEWLEDFLAEYKKAFVIISHDRFLLDHTATRIVEIENGRAESYTGNYTAYVIQREERREAQMKRYEQQAELIARTEDFIRRNIAGQKTKQAKSRRNMLERLERVDKVHSQRAGNFKLQAVARAGDNVLVASDLAVGYDEPLARGLSFLVRRGERLGIIGPNGSGKTTFLRTINGELEPLAGQFTWGANVTIEYYDQELGSLSPRSIVIEEMAAAAPRATEGELRGYLARFLFTGDDILKPVAALSGGEKSRLALAKMIYSRANVLVLDEPTNHLDIPSREALEAALAEYGGTIIAVSHDRYFLDRMATEILHFENGAATYHQGSYSDFYEQRHRKQPIEPAQRSAGPVPDAAARERPRPPVEQKRRSNKQPRRTPDEIEEQIRLLELEREDLISRLSNPAPDLRPEDYEGISTRQQTIESELERLFDEWEESSASSRR